MPFLENFNIRSIGPLGQVFCTFVWYYCYYKIVYSTCHYNNHFFILWCLTCRRPVWECLFVTCVSHQGLESGSLRAVWFAIIFWVRRIECQVGFWLLHKSPVPGEGRLRSSELSWFWSLQLPGFSLPASAWLRANEVGLCAQQSWESAAGHGWSVDGSGSREFPVDDGDALQLILEWPVLLRLCNRNQDNISGWPSNSIQSLSTYQKENKWHFPFRLGS